VPQFVPEPIVPVAAPEPIQTPQTPEIQAPQTFVPEQATFNAAAAIALWQASPFALAEVAATDQASPGGSHIPTQEPVPSYQPVEQPVQSAPAAPVQVAPPVPQPAAFEVPSTDRVDDLLRQFRERYGRG
jgi:hypothetical protein